MKRLTLLVLLWVVLLPPGAEGQDSGPTITPPSAAPSDPLQRWKNERAAVVAQKGDLEKKVKEWQDKAATRPTASGKQLALSQAEELGQQVAALVRIIDKYDEILDVSELLPALSSTQQPKAMETLGRLQQELAALRASAAQPPSPVTTPSSSPPSAPPAPQTAAQATTGTLTGTILAEDGKQPIPNAVVLVRCGEKGDYQATTRTDDQGVYTFTHLPAGPCLVRAAKYLSPEEGVDAKRELRRLEEAEEGKAKQAGVSDPGEWARSSAWKALGIQYKSYQERTLKPLTITAGAPTVATNISLEPRRASMGEFARTIVGFEQAGASAAPSTQKFFFDLWLSVPAPFWSRAWKDPNFGPPFRLWGNVRVSSVPQQITSSLGDFAVRFPQQVSELKVNEVAQSAEFLAGGEVRLAHWGVSKSRLLSFDQSTRERFGMYLVFGGGTSTPLTPRETLQVFEVPPMGSVPAFDQQIQDLGLTTQLAGKQFIAFASQDRDRFFRQYYGGIRLKTFYYNRDTDEPLRRFPGTLDVLLGQNEAITGGRLHRAVLRLEGFFPLPFSEVRDIFLFGTAELIPGRPNISDAIILQPAPANTPVPAANVLLVSSPQLNRDHYRLGVGLDFLSLIQHIKERNNDKPTSK